MQEQAKPTLADAVRVIPAQCYDNPTWKGLAWLTRDLLVYGVIVAALIASDSLVLLIPLWILAALAISALFILGHDAAHGSLFQSGRLNYLVGQLAMLPSLHLFEAWVFGHNRIHHGHTTRQLMDYVWHPLTPQEYEALSPRAKLAHKLKWSWLGAGIYYLHEIWWEKMIWKFVPHERARKAVRRDRIVVGSYAAFVSGALLVGGFAAYGGVSGALWTWVKVFGIPFLLWNYSIGFAVYVHHISQDISWHKRRDWDKFRGQVEGTTVIHFPAWLNFFYHNIFLHVAHHVDMRIPFYGLPAANRALLEHFGDAIVERNYALGDYLATTKSCKLFDFDAGGWIRYEEAPAAAVGNAA